MLAPLRPRESEARQFASFPALGNQLERLPMTGSIKSLFATRIYRQDLPASGIKQMLLELERAARTMAKEDRAGQTWAQEHDYLGYTSYATLEDLPERDPAFADLVNTLRPHVTAFAHALDLDLNRRPLLLDNIWVNVLAPGGLHTSHIHPHAVISGTFYIAVPARASALRFEDPRLPMMMAAPPRKAKAREDNRTFVAFEPKVGTVLLWESWLRHEVLVNRGRSDRISVSFNYRW